MIVDLGTLEVYSIRDYTLLYYIVALQEYSTILVERQPFVDRNVGVASLKYSFPCSSTQSLATHISTLNEQVESPVPLLG